MANIIPLFGEGCVSIESTVPIDNVIEGLASDKDEIKDIVIAIITKDGELDIRSTMGITDAYFLAYKATQKFLEMRIGHEPD